MTTELEQKIAEQAAVIENMRLVLTKYCKDHGINVEHHPIIKLLALQTDSKQTLAEWLDKVLGEPSGWLQTSVEEDANTTLLRDHLPKRFNADWWKFEPLFKKPEIK